ncbi:hypothetical protein M1N16_08800, partial [Nitrospinaceae bacterium]|nr:hypothetical protein [Nitrospinaceae bacterium]
MKKIACFIIVGLAVTALQATTVEAQGGDPNMPPPTTMAPPTGTPGGPPMGDPNMPPPVPADPMGTAVPPMGDPNMPPPVPADPMGTAAVPPTGDAVAKPSIG